MNNRFPIYDLLHQEIKACARHLIEVSSHSQSPADQNSHHIFSRIKELHDFSQKLRTDGHYHPLFDLRHYLENTMVPYTDEQRQWQSMRLSEAVSLLSRPSPELNPFQPQILDSLLSHCMRHFQEEIQPGRPLYGTLQEIHAL